MIFCIHQVVTWQGGCRNGLDSDQRVKGSDLPITTILGREGCHIVRTLSPNKDSYKMLTINQNGHSSEPEPLITLGTAGPPRHMPITDNLNLHLAAGFSENSNPLCSSSEAWVSMGCNYEV